MLHNAELASTQRAAFECTPASPRSVSSYSLNTLPVELLILIFTFGIADNPDIAPALSLVNRQWRAIMLDLPSLWRRLHLSDANFNAQRLRDKAALWFARTRALPLDIELDTCCRDSVLPLLSYMLLGVERWRDVSYMHSRLRFSTVRDGEQPRLESLLVTLAPKKTITSDLQNTSTPPASPRPWWGGADVPMKKTFQANEERLKQIYVLGVRCLPPPEHVAAFDSVTTLVLMSSSTECDFPMHQVVPFLSAFPVLKDLELSNFNELFLVNDPEYRPDCPSLRPAVLPHLQRLSIRGICSSRCILSHLTTPSLRVLSLVHINSSSVYYDFPHPGEPGDSDDESGDFSRSPWTDHATGMGLRRLFARAAPPLRELVMDYADLRTKDFRWLFARLDHLELFHIVASDMSDKVLHALEVDSDVVVAGSAEGSEAGAQRPAILPRLTCLKLAKCQKLTGDAVVRMVSSRVRAAESGRVAAFTELITTECLQVTERDHQELQAIFPPEGRLEYAPGFED
ncbi:hypothetical protein DFH11DRAFT_1861557 [Phellopilus nigrolimitatus]|nr:hypothetical protein DFH11DRAFT_1861557 [Phellopilus nigrolimitatus]